MTPLERALRERIEADGAMTVEAFMDACNAYYYATRDPLGQRGDFTTAPEISQMFGEMIGAALADCWMRAGAPTDAIYAELGPGRGTLAADALRVMRSAGFGGGVHLVDTSPVLRDLQRSAVPAAQFGETVDSLPPVPVLLAANEFLDALSVRQHVAGKERKVVIAGDSLAFDCDGEIVEDSPAREAAARAIASHVAAHGGVALLIDYGHAHSAPGDTLQAVCNHCKVPVLEHPGEQDLTAHVDFEAIATAARSVGARVTRVASQREWLKRLGIERRAEVLAKSNPERSDEIEASLDRLVSEREMGSLFKVMAIHSPAWPAPAGFA